MIDELNVTFKDKTLNPLNFYRVAAANQIGLHIFKLKPEQWDNLTNGTDVIYPEFFFDIARVLFLCSEPTSTSLKATRKPDEVFNDAIKWAEANGIANPFAPEFAEATGAFWSLVIPLLTSAAKQELSVEEVEMRGSKKKKS